MFPKRRPLLVPTIIFWECSGTGQRETDLNQLLLLGKNSFKIMTSPQHSITRMQKE
jgi:hypothetical protein